MIKLDISKVMAMLDQNSLKGKKQATLTCGYTADYAVYVHENLTANHPNGGQAKFLEEPARVYAQYMVNTVVRLLQSKKGLAFALDRAGRDFRQLSRKYVPVDTGYLVNSWVQSVE